jgi:phage gp29-like protein
MAKRASKSTAASAPVAAPEWLRMELLEPSVRAYQEWSPSLLKAAEISADSGFLLFAADLCDAMFADDRIKAVLDSRTDALLGRTLAFEAGLGRRKNAALKALEVEEDWWAAFPETEVKLLHAWGVMLGVGIAELRWEESDANGRLIPRLEVKNPRFLRWDWLTREWKLTVSNDDNVGQHEITITPGDGKWILYTPYGRNRPWVFGAYRALSRWCLLKRYAVQDWGFYSERQGMGMLAITGDGGTKEQRAEMAADVKRVGRNLGFLLPKGFTAQMIESTARSWETFAAQILAADNGAAITILGQNLSTQISAGDGSKAAATEHGKTALGRTKADAETLSTTIHDQALTWWALFNFGDAKLAPWPVWDTTPIEDLKDRAAALQMLGQFIAQANTAGVPIDFGALCDQFGVPLRKITGEKPQSQIYQYDLTFGIVTKNERRAALGLPPMEGGDQPPQPVGAAPAEGDAEAASPVSLMARIERAHRELADALAAAKAA